MKKFSRPDNNYIPIHTNNNINKYQEDRDAIPQVAISAEKIDADFNAAFDGLEEIRKFNLQHKYEDLSDILTKHESYIAENKNNINNITINNITAPKDENTIYMSKDGVNVTTDKLSSQQIKDGAITTDKLANNSITESKIADNAISSRKLQAQSISQREIYPKLINDMPRKSHLVLNDELAIVNSEKKQENSKISLAKLIEFIQQILPNTIGYSTGINANNIIKLDDEAKIPALDGINLKNVRNNFGDYQNLTINRLYQMDQDGILTGSIFNSKSGQNGVATAQIYVGDSADNLTLLAQASCTSISNYNDYANMGNNLCLPIKRNKYFKITIDNKRAGFVIDHYFYFTSLAING